MEPSGIYTSSMGSGMLGLEMSLQPQQHMPQQPPQQQHQHHHHMGVHPYGHHEIDHQNLQAQQQSVRQGFQQYAVAKAKSQSLTLSDDEEPGVAAAENSTDDAKRKTSSPWHRMKWTDNMVRLLIMVVYYIGDEAGSEGNDPSGKKKGAGVLQKKGKWKSVSRAMMERGFYVSPQQCEDKFNDLNKRYKRVNDIIGKGTACRVVENQALLETMDHLSQKMKEEVKKLLNSKHLFFREMCAYHNSCNHGGASTTSAAAACAQNLPEVVAEPSQTQQQRCLHSSEHAHPLGPNLGRAETEGSKIPKGSTSSSEDEDDGEEEDEEEEEDVVEGSVRSHEQEDENEERSSRKRQRKGVMLSGSIQQLRCELMNVVEDGTKSAVEKREWMKARIVQLEEERLGYQTQAFQLEKQRLKWERFSSRKEREMERQRLSNEHLRLENERMVLLVRQKDLELLHLQ